MAHKKGLSLAIRSIISLSLLALLLYIRRGSLGPTIEAVKAIEPIYFISSCGIFIVALMILGARLKMTLRIAGLSMSYPNTHH